MSGSSGISWQGVLMIVVGAWVILRAVTRDSSGRTLIDHILDRPATTTTPAPAVASTATASSPANAAAKTGILNNVLNSAEAVLGGAL